MILQSERILACWLVESYGLWEYRPWKWRNMSRTTRSAGSLIEKNKVYTDGVIFIKLRMILAVVNAIYAIA